MKKTRTHTTMIRLMGALTVALTLGSCAKQRDYKEVYKDQVVSSTDKSGLLKHEYLYVPSQLESPHSNNATFPGWMGQERIVKFKFTEKELVAETVIDDARFSGNSANNKPVVSIPVSHIQYRCADNGAGECANREEEANDIPWQQRNQFKPTVEAMTVADANTLPIEIDKLFGDNCNSEIGSRVISANFSEDAVNIEVEKTYRANIDCLSELDSLSDLTFNVRHMHSFIRRDKLIAKDYQAVKYPQTDENTFGFFTTDKFKLSVDNRPEERGEEVLMNRWNPKRKTIPYVLSSNFDKPEMKRVKEATLESIQAVNNAFKAANVDLKIEVKENNGANFGDLRNSMIVLVEDPQATGVIGYGPSIADPRTGEIVSARTVMYLGTMKKFVRSTWDEVVAEAKALEASTALAGGTGNLVRHFGQPNAQNQVPDFQLAKDTPAKQKAREFLKKLQPKIDLEKAIARGEISEIGAPAPVRNGSTPLVRADDATIKKLQKDLLRQRESKVVKAQLFDTEDPVAAREARLNTLTRYNVYPADYVNFTGAIKLANLDELKDLPKVEWEELTDAQQEKVVEVILPYVWVPTLVHELGHNMGLRHNFAGSEDKANFYSQEEAAHFGHNHPMQYSSIMDYGYHNLNELRVMGKYDVAALRYGYNRQVEKTDGSVVEVATTLAEMPAAERENLKDFRYCTDENTGINAGCRRFDEGTNYTEIAQHLTRAYEESYKRANLRNGRRSFSDTTDGGYLQRIANTYFDLRPFFESYEMIQAKYGFAENHPIWTQNEFLKDLKQATLVARQALMAPMLVPSTTCLVQNEAGEIEDYPMQALGGFFPSCFHPDAVEVLTGAGLKPLGQLGKSFRNEKFETSTNPYVDQIDVRGTWADKLLSPIFLTSRRLGVSTWDKYTGNYLDRVGGTLNTMVGIMSDFLMNEVTTSADVTLASGAKLNLKEYKYYPMSTHMVPVPRSRGLQRALGLSEEKPYAEMLLQNVLAEMRNNMPSAQARALRNYFGIREVIREGDTYANYQAVEVDGTRYFIHKKENAFAMSVFEQLTIVKTLDKVKKERLPVVLAAALAAEAPPAPTPEPSTEPSPAPSEAPVELSADEKAAVALGSEAIQAYMEDTFQSASYLELVMKMLGRVNRNVTY